MVFSSVPSAVDGAEHQPAVNPPPAADGNGGEDKMEGKRGDMCRWDLNGNVKPP